MNARAGKANDRTLLSTKKPNRERGYAASSERGSAEVKYQWKACVPHSELLFNTELNQKTSNSGHNNLFHIIESINMVIPTQKKAIPVQYFRAPHTEIFFVFPEEVVGQGDQEVTACHI